MTSLPRLLCEHAALVAAFIHEHLLLAAHIKPSSLAILSAALQLSGAMDPFLDHLERDDDVITNGSRTTVYTFILQEVMKPL